MLNGVRSERWREIRIRSVGRIPIKCGGPGYFLVCADPVIESVKSSHVLRLLMVPIAWVVIAIFGRVLGLLRCRQ